MRVQVTLQQYDDDDNGLFLGLAVELRLAHNVVSPVQGVNNGVNFRREVFCMRSLLLFQ